MAGNTAYKLGIVISADASSVKPAAAETKNEIASIGEAAIVTETKMQRLIATATGLHSGAANSNQRAWMGALADEGMALDQLRAKYNPMFAVIQNYRDAKAEIRTANAMGALSVNEMTAALGRERQAALASIDVIKGRASALKSANGQNFAATNTMFQLQDIGVTAAMGMNPAMIAMQQGTQIAGGMAGMNLKQAGSTLVGAFTQLLSPVSFATVAVTGLTAAAIQYAMTWTGNAKSLSKSLEEHESQIKALRDAYQYAGTGADEYYQRLNAGTRFLAVGSRTELEKRIRTDTDSILGQLGRVSSGSMWQDAFNFVGDDAEWMVNSPYKEFEKAILHLQRTAKNGKPDILGFRRLVEERWYLEPNNKSIKETAKELLELGPAALQAAVQLERLKEARARFVESEERRRSGAYMDGNSSLLSIASLQKSDRRQVQESYATARGNASNREERDDALRQRDEALARINSQEARQIQLAQIDIQLLTARNPLTRAQLAAERERIELQAMNISAAEAQTRVEQVRNQVMAEALAQSSADIIDMRAEVDARKSVTDAIIAGTISSADAQTYLQAESALRPLIAAAARAEGEEKQKLLSIIGQMTAGYKELAEEQRRANAVEMIDGQKDTAKQLQLELSLVSSGELVRRRALSVLQAEQDLKRAGIAVESELGKQYRQNAQALTEARITLERQTDAWSQYQSAGENAIDGIFDALGSGDYKDALKSIGLEITRTFTDLAVKNPLKNALFGSNLGTLDDLLSPKSGSGLLSGILGGQSVGAMNVQAAVVNVGGVGLGGADGLLSNVSRMFGAANSNVPGAGLGMSQYASAIKLIESAGSGGYSALGPITANGDRAYGAYQVMGANIPSWTKSALGFSMSPQDYLKSSSAQDAVFNKIFGGYVDKFGASGAAQAWFGGPGSVGRGGGVADMLGTTGTDYVNKFNTALGQVTATAGSTSNTLNGLASNVGTAGAGLNQLGSGFNSFGQQLSSMSLGGGGFSFNMGSLFPGASGFQSQQLANAIASGIPGLWSSGGYTGPGAVDEPKGIVHAGEVVWSQRDVARAGGVHVVEGMRLGRRGYSNGGAVADVAPSPIARFNSPSAGQSSAMAMRPSLTVHQDLRGSSGEDVKQKAYDGMMEALEEYDNNLPDRLQQINEQPRWR
ncbi:phage tail length tape measure family protein [Brucella sp. TWI432]